MINKEEIPITNDLVLIGGGHSHLSVLMELSKKPLKGNRITLISNEIDTPYSGMIPGFMEGIYSWRESHIDLYKLCIKLNIRFIHSEVTKISAMNKEVYLKGRPKLKFDVLSINSGIESDNSKIEGAKKNSVPVKPISRLAGNFLKEIKNFNTIAFIGGGAGSVELALALKKRFNNTNKKIEITIVTGKNGILNSFPKKTKQIAINVLKESNIKLLENKEVIQVKKNKLLMSDGTYLNIDKSILSTNAMAPKWIEKSDIKLNKDNFIVVNDAFQTNHKFIFAAGDIVDFNKENLKKAGVFAVRSGKPLAKSIRNYISNEKNFAYKFNKNYLALIGLSNGLAIATKYNFSCSTKLNFYLKKYIDQRFIKKFNELNNNQISKIKKIFIGYIYKTFKTNNIYEHDETNQMQCRGCAAKVPYNALQNTLSKKIIATSEDATPINNHPNLFQSVDMINAIISDPFILGKIAANHAISDIVSVNSNIISAMMILQLPLSKSIINSRDLEQVTYGANQIFEFYNCSINGGHTMIGKDQDPVIGFAITGEQKEHLNFKKTSRNINVDDILILTNKIGSGIIFAGINNDLIDSYFQIEVIKQMEDGNIAFGNITEKLKILSMTDITGFGLANHLLNLIKRDNGKTGLSIFPRKIPVFDGVEEAIKKKVKSSLFENNYLIAKKEIVYDRDEDCIDEILYDPQTVGGLAFIIPKEEKEKQFQILKKYKINFTEIGYVNNLDNKIKVL